MTAEDRLTTLLLQASNDLQKLYDKIIDELTRATAKSVEAVNPDDLYTIAKACTPSEQKRVQALLDTYTKALIALVKQGITRSVLLSSNTQQKALSAYTRMQGKAVDEWRASTANAFIESRLKRAGGLSLSDRVWNYSQQTKAEFELAMSQVLEKGIAKGISAESLGRKIRNLLKYPDMMYRRYHLKKLMSDGTKKDVVEWRRRVIDKDGKVRFIKEDLAKVGTGVYRSARQNALRLTITETNMAYNYANCKRWSDEPFVLGINIRLSGNHPVTDICDELAGDYPKDFMWRGWHPRCRCTMSSILMDRDSEEWKTLRSMSAKEYNTYKSPNNVKNVPKKFKKWCEKNEEKLTKARKANKLPYFVMDNEKLVGDIVGWKEEEKITNTTNNANPKKGYKGRNAKNEAYEVYKDDKPTTISKEQEKNVLEIAKLMGIKMDKVKPMSFKEADNGRANINYHKGNEYKENCQSCVVVHEARLRGLNITAKGYSETKGSASYELGEHFENAWINPKTGKVPQPTIIKYGEDWLQKAENQMKANGRYHIGINTKEGNGHVIAAERINNRMIYYDPQLNTFINIRECNISYLEILKVDRLLLNSSIVSFISKII